MDKLCTKCKEVKDRSLFYNNKGHKDGLAFMCKVCSNLRSVEYARNNRATIRAKRHDLKTRYGITKEEYATLLEYQAGRCAICDSEGCPTGRALAVDHCHTTNKVRGLLCSHCNMGLGMFKDSTPRLTSAIQYLKEHEE